MGPFLTDYSLCRQLQSLTISSSSSSTTTTPSTHPSHSPQIITVTKITAISPSYINTITSFSHFPLPKQNTLTKILTWLPLLSQACSSPPSSPPPWRRCWWRDSSSKSGRKRVGGSPPERNRRRTTNGPPQTGSTLEIQLVSKINKLATNFSFSS